MATMHYLFFGVLSVAVLFLGGFGNRAVKQGTFENQSRAMAVNSTPVHHNRIDNFRERIVAMAAHEIGVREATGSNDGARVEEYLAYTGLGKGHAWCAAFASWCYGQAGLSAPRNAWSPALFPIARRYTRQQIRPADLFAIYNQRLGRINHVGIVQKIEGSWLLTIEGNVADRVLSKRRSRATVYTFSNWLD
ncbi:hypothetical protein D3C87_775250 [compost metagenome]